MKVLNAKLQINLNINLRPFLLINTIFERTFSKVFFKQSRKMKLIFKIEQNPILIPTENSNLFDSLRVDDSCFIIRNNKIYMYYKGRQVDHTPNETKMGLAIADNPDGPYVRYSKQPIVNGGHEVCCWAHGNGVAALFCNVGEAGNSLQYSDDGIHFEKICDTVPSKAPGPFRADNFVNGSAPNGTKLRPINRDF